MSPLELRISFVHYYRLVSVLHHEIGDLIRPEHNLIGSDPLLLQKPYSAWETALPSTGKRDFPHDDKATSRDLAQRFN